MAATAGKTEHLNEHIDFVENEIELIEYLRVIWKWKYKILAGALICAIVAGVVGFRAPQLYRVETILKLYEINRTMGKPEYIDSPSSIESMIELDMLRNNILAYLKKSENLDIYSISEFKVTLLGAGNFLQISYDTADAQLGVNIVNSLKPVLLKKYKEKIKFLQYDHFKYQNKKSENYQLEVEMEVLQTDINNLSKRISELKLVLDSQNSNLKMMIKRRDRLIDENKNDNLLPVFLHNNTIQQNIALINTYKNDLFQYNSDREYKKAALKKSESQFKAHQEELKLLESTQNNFQYIQVIRHPDKNIKLVKTKTKQYVLFGVVSGLFMMLSLSFFWEFILKPEKQKGN